MPQTATARPSVRASVLDRTTQRGFCPVGVVNLPVQESRLDHVGPVLYSDGVCLHLVFFFQAEDGIRYLTVTGVQTCALPIWIGAEGVLEESGRVDSKDRVMRDQRVFPGLGDNRLDELARSGGAEVELPTVDELEVHLTLAEPLRNPLRSGDRVPHLLDRMPEPALEAKDVPPVDLFDRAVGRRGLPGRARRHAYSSSFGWSVRS